MLRWRLLLGVPLVAGLAFLCWLDANASIAGVYLAPLALLLSVAAAWELNRIFRAAGHAPLPAAVFVTAVLPLAATCAPILAFQQKHPDHGGQMTTAAYLAGGLVSSILLAMALEMRRFSQPGQSIVNVALCGLGALYVGGCMSVLVLLRIMPLGEKTNLVPLVALIAIVKLSDTCQFVVGKALGKHKIAPLLSPGKTWEGAVGGIGLAVVAAGLASRWTASQITLSSDSALMLGAGFALCVSVAGLIGDLAESLLKRDAGVKDSGGWLPGFGGVLDLTDSLLFAAPAGYCYLVVANKYVGL